MTLHLALTGGIGSGKSTAARMLVGHGAVLIDADVLAREVVAAGSPALVEIAETFGDRVLTPGGDLDRSALAETVFTDDDARDRLNAIVHPAVRRAAQDQRAAALAADPGAIVVEDIPLLVETSGAGRFHAVIVVSAPVPVRLQRLLERGMTEADAEARIAAQSSEEERLEIADMVLDNGGSIEDLQRQVERLWATRLEPFRDALAARTAGADLRGEPDRRQIDNGLRRIRTALADAGLGELPLQVSGGSRIILYSAARGIGDALLGAGYVPSGPGLFTSGDPGAGLLVEVREDAPEEVVHVG